MSRFPRFAAGRFAPPLLSAALLLFACQPALADPADPPSDGSQVRATNFEAGYRDGCTSAQSSRIVPKMQRNDTAFHASESYRTGWNQGYTGCKAQSDNTPERLLGAPFGNRW